MSDKPKKLTGIWRGYISGTNRAVIFVRFQHKDVGLKAQAVVLDHQFGPSIIRLSGSIENQKAQLRLLSFLGHAPLRPLDGQISLTLDEKFSTAEGNWSTDIGTTGTCKLLRSNESDLRWYWRLRRIRLGWFVMRWRNTVYCAVLLCVAVAALTQRVQISWQSLILLLLPAPFLFSPHLARLAGILQIARVKKIGPIEFQIPATPEILAAANPQGQESVVINQLNQFFALRTKVLLAVLAHSNGMPVSDFSQLARSFGVPDENLEITMKAIIQMGCAQLTDNKIIPTAWGQRYVRFGLRLA
jgi:hypothetical protein